MRTNRKYRKLRRKLTHKRIRKEWRGGMNNTSKKVLFCKLHAGLGNQLFIYAGALAIKDLLGMKLILIKADDNPHSANSYTQYFKKGEFLNLADVKERFDKAVKLPEQYGQTSPEFMSKLSEYKGADCKLERVFYHNFKLVEPVIQIIRNDFVGELDRSYPNFKKSVLNNSSEDKFFFVHVRMGDFKEVKWSSPVEYYTSALSIIENVAEVIYIISDDIDFCQKQINDKKWNSNKFRLFGDPDELKAMYLMSMCKGGAVLCSSTFSWWGAMFGPHENKQSIIIYPKGAEERNLTFPERTGQKWMTVPE